MKLFECLPSKATSLSTANHDDPSNPHSKDESETEIKPETLAYKLPTLISPRYIPLLHSLAIRLVLVGHHMQCLNIYRYRFQIPTKPINRQGQFLFKLLCCLHTNLCQLYDFALALVCHLNRDARANALQQSLNYLGVQKIGKGELQKTEWENIETEIPMWIDLMRISVSSLKLIFYQIT
jgi:exocyst complex component 7